MIRVIVAFLLVLASFGAPARAADPPEAVAERCIRLLWDGAAAEAHGTFDEGMKVALGPEKLAEVVAKERAPRGPIRGLTSLGVRDKGGYAQVQLLARFETGIPLKFTVGVRPDGRIAGLFFVPARTDVTPKDIEAAIAAVPGRVAVEALVAERPEIAYRVRSAEPFSVGSQFKVLILARAAEMVASGSLRLDDRVEISARSRSFPSGILQDFDPGLKPTVNDLLTHMIAISDNTATDTLLWKLGRERIESRLEAWGFKSRPMLFSTAEMFALASGLGGMPSGAADRRATLAALDRPARYAAAGRALAAVMADRQRAEAQMNEFYELAPYAHRTALSHLLDWQIPATELADFYRRVALERFESPAVSRVVSRYLHKGGAGIIGARLANDVRVKGIARKGGSDAGIMTDGGFVTTADGRHVVIVVAANDLPLDAADDAVIPKIAELSELLFDYLESRSRG